MSTFDISWATGMFFLFPFHFDSILLMKFLGTNYNDSTPRSASHTATASHWDGNDEASGRMTCQWWIFRGFIGWRCLNCKVINTYVQVFVTQYMPYRSKAHKTSACGGFFDCVHFWLKSMGRYGNFSVCNWVSTLIKVSIVSYLNVLLVQLHMPVAQCRVRLLSGV